MGVYILGNGRMMLHKGMVDCCIKMGTSIKVCGWGIWQVDWAHFIIKWGDFIEENGDMTSKMAMVMKIILMVHYLKAIIRMDINMVMANWCSEMAIIMLVNSLKIE